MSEDYQNDIDESPDEETKELMEGHDLDQDTAEQVREAIDEYGVDENGKKGSGTFL